MLAVLTVCPALKPDEVFAMDALFSLALCGSYIRRQKSAGGDGAGPARSQRRDLGNGVVSQSIGSMSELAAALAAGRGGREPQGGPSKRDWVGIPVALSAINGRTAGPQQP